MKFSKCLPPVVLLHLVVRNGGQAKMQAMSEVNMNVGFEIELGCDFQ
jgi:hypothetical protein